MAALRAALIWVVLLAPPVLAQEAETPPSPPEGGGASVGLDMGDHDSTLPIEITSNDLKLDQAANNALFTGDVVAVQGNLTLTSEWMLVEYERDPETGANEIWRVTARIDVVMVQEHPDEKDKKPDVAESENAVYTVADETMVLTEDVLVVQDGTVLTSDRLDYYLPTGRGVMTGNVTTLIIPEKDKDRTAEETETQ